MGRALAAIAAECAALGREIEDTGSALSGGTPLADAAARNLQMQAFDRLSQGAHALSQMTAFLARHIYAGEACSLADISDIVDHMPLPDVRKRFKLAVGLAVLSAVPDNDDGDVWFDNEEDGYVPG